jgi:hypothetical protein
LIFEFSFVEGALYEYPLENILRTAKFLPTWGWLEVQKPTQALQSVNGLANAVD